MATLPALDDAHTRPRVIESLRKPKLIDLVVLLASAFPDGGDTFMGGLQNALALALGPAINIAIGGIPAAVNAAVPGAVNAAINAAVPPLFTANTESLGAVSAAINAAVPEAVNAAINAAVPGAVSAAINAAVPEAVNAAVNAAIPGAVNAALGPVQAALDLLTSQVHCSMARAHNKEAELRGAPFQGIHKSVPGSGQTLALGLAPVGVPPPPPTINAINAVSPLIAAVTRAQVLNFTHVQILALVEFYNEQMSILPTDNISERRVKVYDWMRW
ncbi:hypothetical protein C8R44DRAFT_889015 [Mycena epipterygia]|nr:hypothetical protein C8R44DRAFT_889015 [Mycena epipterygia]